MAGKKAFYVRYDHRGVDSDVAIGLAGKGDDNVYWINFDTLGFSPFTPREGEQLLDNGHSIVNDVPNRFTFELTVRPIQTDLPAFLRPENDPGRVEDS
jgi:hypothetical protein